MVKKGLNPLNVFHLQLPVEQVYKRTAPTAMSDFACDRTILARRLQHISKQQPLAAYFFQKFYNSLTVIDGLKSRWFVETLALEAVEKCMKARLQFARDYFFKKDKHGFERPCIMENMNYDRVYLK
jgi:adenylate/nucleoside-diphosphate kinase